MSPRLLLSFALILSALAGTGCNEIIGARRYEVRDGAAPGVDAARPDAAAPVDSGPGPDAGDCAPSELETYYLDEDGDTYGRLDVSVEACSQPSGYADRPGDCNDDVATAYPGAPEICDDADSDCDGTIDEGLLGPVGAPFEIISSSDGGSIFQSAVAAYGGGYLAVSGGAARWLDASGNPSSTVFRHESAASVNSDDRVAAFVFEGTSPPRGVIARFDVSSPPVPSAVHVFAYSANETGSALSGLTVIRAPSESAGDDVTFVEVADLDLVPMGDQIAVVANFTGGDDSTLARFAGFNPSTWATIGSYDEYWMNSYGSAMPIASTPPSALLAIRNTDTISVWAELLWMTASPSGVAIDFDPALDLGSGTSIVVTSANRGVDPAAEALMVVDDSAVCLHSVTVPAAGSPLTLGACPGAITWAPRQMQIRQGVVSVLTSTGFLEVPRNASTGGTPQQTVTLGSLPHMAMRDRNGLIVYTQASALMGQRIDCRTP